jgi:hypothetical protein
MATKDEQFALEEETRLIIEHQTFFYLTRQWGANFRLRDLPSVSYDKTGTKNPNFGKVYSDIEKRKLSLAQAKQVPIVQLNEHDEVIAEYPSVRFAARELSLNASHISACCRNKNYRKTVGGFSWRYK